MKHDASQRNGQKIEEVKAGNSDDETASDDAGFATVGVGISQHIAITLCISIFCPFEHGPRSMRKQRNIKGQWQTTNPKCILGLSSEESQGFEKRSQLENSRTEIEEERYKQYDLDIKKQSANR
jgi:hypothetical protein